jgi:hypothetical protein
MLKAPTAYFPLVASINISFADTIDILASFKIRNDLNQTVELKSTS